MFLLYGTCLILGVNQLFGESEDDLGIKKLSCSFFTHLPCSVEIPIAILLADETHDEVLFKGLIEGLISIQLRLSTKFHVHICFNFFGLVKMPDVFL